MINIKFIGLLVFLIGIATLQVSAQNQQKPNVIFILADDLGWGDLSCYGNTKINTPNLDMLANNGMLFTNFYVASPICSPTRASFLSGRYPSRDSIYTAMGINNDAFIATQSSALLDTTLTTYANLLKNAGYNTIHLGKTHVYIREEESSGMKNYGFNISRPVKNDEENYLIEASQKPHLSTRVIIDNAIQYIDENVNGNFLLNIWLQDPHALLNPTKTQLEKANSLTSKDSRYISQAQIYYSVVLQIDRQIGRLVNHLKQKGLYENTIIIFTSDNGPESEEIVSAAHSGAGSTGPFRGLKRSLYDGGIRVPFIISWPAQIPKNVINYQTVMSSIDFLPTLAGLTGLQQDIQDLPIDGKDLSSILLTNQNLERNEPIFWERRFAMNRGNPFELSPHLAIRKGAWKLLANADSTNLELYHLLSDPSELHNLVHQKPGLASELYDELKQWKSTLPIGPEVRTVYTYPWPADESYYSAPDIRSGVVYDTTNITLYDTTFVTLYDTTQVTLYDTALVTLYDTALVTLYDTTLVTLYDTILVTLYDTILVTLYDTTLVTLYDTTLVTLYDTTLVTLYDTTLVTLYDTTLVTLYDTIQVALYDTIQVTLYDTTQVNLYDTIQVTLYDTIQITLYDTIFYYDTLVVMDTVCVTNTTDTGSARTTVETSETNKTWKIYSDTLKIMRPKEIVAHQPEAIFLYPNPAQVGIYLEFDYPVVDHRTELKLTDAKGRVIRVSQPSDTIYFMDMSDLSAGMYYLYVTQGDRVVVRKILKE